MEEPWIGHQEARDPFQGSTSLTKGKPILPSSLIEEHTHIQNRGVVKIKC